MDYVTWSAPRIALANLSLTCPRSEALNAAIRKGTSAGVAFVVAAGNDSSDAASVSPASEPSAIVVGALADSDGRPGGHGAATGFGEDDTFATFSNYGPCVWLLAPGVGIYSCWKEGAYQLLTGTSMAAAEVTGAAAGRLCRDGRDLNHDGKLNRADVSKLAELLSGVGELHAPEPGADAERAWLIPGPDGRYYARVETAVPDPPNRGR